AMLTKFRDHHQAHADAFTKALESASIPAPGKQDSYDLPGPGGGAPDLSSQSGVLAFAAHLEGLSVKSYAAGIGHFSTGELAQAAANVMGDEARHAAALRVAAGGPAIPSPFVDQQ